jgi:hypothetical protein
MSKSVKIDFCATDIKIGQKVNDYFYSQFTAANFGEFWLKSVNW